MLYRSVLTSFFALGLLAALTASPVAHAQAEGPTALTPTAAEDYTYAYWLNGWRKHKENKNPDVLCFETSQYGLTMNPAELDRPQLGRLSDKTDYRSSIAAGTSRVEDLPAASLHVDLLVDGKRYRAKRSLAADAPAPRRLQNVWQWESGRFAQHYEFIDLVFADASGKTLPTTANLRVTAWPSSVTFDARIRPSPAYLDATAPGATGAGWCINDEPLTLPHDAGMENAHFTFETWVHVPERLAKRNGRGWIANKNLNHHQDGFYGFRMWGNTVTSMLNIGGGRDNIAELNAHAQLRQGAWNHLAMTYDGETFRHYINGKDFGKKVVGRARKTAKGALVLGARADNKRERSKLIIDDLRVWNRALTHEDIKAHAANPAKIATRNGLTFEKDFGQAIEDANQDVTWTNAKISMSMRSAAGNWKAERTLAGAWAANQTHTLSLPCDIAASSPNKPSTQIRVTNADGRKTSAAFHPMRNCYVAEVGPFRRSWAAGYTDIRDYDTFEIVVNNTDAAATRVPFMLYLKHPANMTGMSPILCEPDGTPTGIPVQLSKNWHETNIGPYLCAYTMLPAEPGETRYQLRIPYGFYGTVPAASHAQLSLVGWGGNGRWDQLAIGCWGETICFDMDLSCVDVVITDVRGLMLRNGKQGASWGWTDAGWGGDWMHVLGKNNRKLLFSGMKTAYYAQGPCLTDVEHQGFYGPNREVQLGVHIQTLRTDDYARTFQNLDYTFRETLPAKDAYFMRQGGNHGWYTPKIAYGNRDGLIAEITPEPGLKAGDTLADRLELTGRGPWWIAFPGAGPHSSKSATGSRALIIRSYDAAFGGKATRAPSISLPVKKQQADGSVDVNLLLTPPKGVQQFASGDRVTFDAQWITVPRIADDYYGPNEGLRKHLARSPRSWKTVHREAAGNDLQLNVQGGDVLQRYPIRVAATQPDVKVTIQGGVGYVPLQISGLQSVQGYALYRVLNGEHIPLNQAVHGNDFWQTDYDPATSTYSLTYNLPLDDLEISTWVLKQSSE